MKMKIIAGKHKCNKDMEFRINRIQEDEDVKDSPSLAWMIHGVCKKCRVVVVSAIFIQSHQPMPDIDYMIDYEQVADEFRGDVR